jgi:hypothetical protein
VGGEVLNAAGSGSTSQIVCGIDWVTANARSGAGIEVANMSLGGQSLFGSFSGCNSSFDPMHAAICRSVNAGVTYAVAAGNSAANANSFVPAAALYKAGNPGASPAQVRTALQAAGNLGWNDADDPDPTKERLLNVDAF